ncbi:hypothetical protein L9F63_013626, partial [Diploptera punctata]
SSLPKNVDEFYQLCYVKADNTVCGASVPFQFRHPYENELCAVEEAGGLLVVRSRSAVTEEKLREAIAMKEQLQKEKAALEKNLSEQKEELNKVSDQLNEVVLMLKTTEIEKQELEERLDKTLHVERHVQRLNEDLVALDAEKNQSLVKLNKAEQHITVLTATVDTLSADKEYMAQLLRSETQNKCGVVAEVGEYKSQVDGLNHMLEALTQSKELVAQELRIQQATNSQLMEDIRRLEIETREQAARIAELKKEKKSLEDLLEQALNSDKSGKDEQIKALEKEREQLLSQLVHSASKKQEELREKTRMYEEEVRGARSQIVELEKQLGESKVKLEDKMKDLMEADQKNVCLMKKLSDCQQLIKDNKQLLDDLKKERAESEINLNRLAEAYLVTQEHNERSAQKIEALEEEIAPLRKQFQQSNISAQRHQYFRKVFADLEDKIANLEIDHEDAVSYQKLQQDRVNAINERIAELGAEVEKLNVERMDVAANMEDQEAQLSLKSMEHQPNSYWKSDSLAFNEEVNELKLYVESSKMRISDIDQQLKEIDEERTVLTQQHIQALDRKNSWERRETDIRRELEELHEREREIVKEQGGQLAVMEEQLQQALTHNTEMLASGLCREEELALAKQEKERLEKKLQETSSTSEQECSSLNSSDVNTCLKLEEKLQMRLQMAADEYKKLYIEKEKVERRLAKLYSKIQEKNKSSAAQPVTAELISISQSSEADARANVVAPSQLSEYGSMACPICFANFPPGAADLFRQHFDGHLS